MAIIPSAAIVKRLRQVLQDGLGARRAIAATRFDGDFPEGLDGSEELRRALDSPRVRVRFPGLDKSKASPPVMGNLLIYELPVEVEVTRMVGLLEQMSDADYDAIEALALDDFDVVRQALECAENLRGTAAVVTGAAGVFSALDTLTLIVSITDVNAAAVVVNTTFQAGDTTPALAAARIEAACVAAGLPAGRSWAVALATAASTEVRIASVNSGTAAVVTVTGGTGAAALGLTGATDTGVATDLATGMLSWVRATKRVDGIINAGAQRLISTHYFIGRAQSRPSTS